jgi:hypothetical protein
MLNRPPGTDEVKAARDRRPRPSAKGENEPDNQAGHADRAQHGRSDEEPPPAGALPRLLDQRLELVR